MKNIKIIITLFLILGMFDLTITKSNGKTIKYSLSLLFNIVVLILLNLYVF